MVPAGSRLALAVTGTNEVVFLDQLGEVVERWSPDAHAESDSWHLNSLVAWDGRLAMTCFGRFTNYREYAGRAQGTGLLVEIPSGAVLASGLTFPHDPCRLESGWLINDALRHRTVSIPDGELLPEVVCDWPLFARGLLVTPRWLVVGLSRWRHDGGGAGSGAVAVVDRQTRAVVRMVPLPFAEIGHIVPAPSRELLTTMRVKGPRLAVLEPPREEPFPPEERRGGVAALGPLDVSTHAGQVEATVRLSNESKEVWSSHDDRPVRLCCQALDVAGEVLEPAAPPQDLPMPVLPGRTLTFRAVFDLGGGAWRTPPAYMRLTLVSLGGEWWAAGPSWRPCSLPLEPAVAVRLYFALAQARRERCDALERERLTLSDLAARYAAMADLGPMSVAVARQLRRWSRRLPGVTTLVKRVLH
jgi:hypothetical protein